jgi:hypothetical protein
MPQDMDNSSEEPSLPWRRRPATPNEDPTKSTDSKRPVLPTSAIAPKPAAPASRYVRPVPLFRRLEFRRTIIPILLTLGVALPIVGALPMIVPADSAFAPIDRMYSFTFFIVGAVLFVLAVMNMIAVKHQLAQKKP